MDIVWECISSLFFSAISLSQLESSEVMYRRAREGFRAIATRGAVCFNVEQYLHVVDPLYQVSFQQFLHIYDMAIAHSDRSGKWG